MSDTEHYHTDAIECPYCRYKQPPDEAMYHDEMLTELDCNSCGKTFDVSVHVQWSWTTKEQKGGAG